MADNDIIEEICVGHGKRSLVASLFQRIMLLFSVDVQFSSPEESAAKSGTQWLALKGEKDNVDKAKEYVKSLCNPELELEVPFSERFYEILFKSLDELEKTTSAVLKFTSRNSCHLQGSAVSVTMAQSAIEDKLRTPPTSHPPSVPAIEPQLREFARKLGYSNQVIDQAVQKLGPDVSQNTLLNELLKTTASLPYQISASAQPKPTSAMGPYPVRREVVARGAPNTSAHVLRAGYENPRAAVPSVQHSWERDLMAKGASAMPRPNHELYPEAIPRGTKRVLERPPDIIARGAGPSVPPLMQVQPYSNPGPSPYENHREASSSASDRLDEQEQLMYQQILGAKKVSGNSSSNLRPVVIDGSNVAMSHGRQDIFSCRGIQLCVEWFRARGHKEITVFVPLWRKEASRPDKPITDQDILYSLERDGILVFTPSRKVNGRRIVCYDDRFIIKLAAETDGVVVSNDNFRDLTNENPKWRETIEQRLLMYSFVGDKFMVPDDPLGKHGPNLANRGPDPMFEYQEFRSNILDNLQETVFNKPLCEVMHNQKYFNGIGNYLRAEIIFRAAVPPFSSARSVLEKLKVNEEESMSKVSKGKKCKVKHPDFLELCNLVPKEVINLPYDPTGNYSDYSAFLEWRQCYYKPEMRNIVDHDGRTIWFKGEAGPLVPKDAKSRGIRTSKKRKTEKVKKEKNGEEETKVDHAPPKKKKKKTKTPPKATVKKEPKKKTVVGKESRKKRSSGKQQNAPVRRSLRLNKDIRK